MTSKWERYAPLAGVVAVVLWVVGVMIAGEEPGENATPEDVLALLQETSGQIVVGATLFSIGVMAFLWFAGSVRVRLFEAEPGSGRLTGTAFAGAIGAAVALMAIWVPQVSAAIAVDDEMMQIAPEAAQALWMAADGFFLVAEMMSAVFLFALALVSLRFGAFPKWVAWIAIAMGVVMMIPPIGWAALIFVFPLWIIAVSVLMFREGAAATGTAAAAVGGPA